MHPLQMHKYWIDDFWKNLGGNKNLGYRLSPKKKMYQLKRLAQVEIPIRSAYLNRMRRTKFDKIKYKRHSLRSHQACFVCGSKGDNVRHHIILLKNGGINSKRNVVTLCKPCHSEIHPWLKDK